MRVAVLSSNFRGFGAYCLPALAQAAGVELAVVIYNQGLGLSKHPIRGRVLRKIFRIGILGALNGIRMRKWYRDDVGARLRTAPLDVMAGDFGIRVETTPTLNCKRTIELLRAADVDLGLSLGNGYIAKRVFSVPRWGMLNVHHEILPEFRGAQSVIWQIYEGSRHSGYTIHRIDERIDTG